MTRLAIVGNSHVGALKRAWDEMAPKPEDVDLTFFAVPDKLRRHFRLTGDLVYAPRPRIRSEQPVIVETAEKINGASSIALAGLDAVVLYGGSLLQSEFATVIGTYDVDGYRAAGAPRRMSRAAFEAFCDSYAEATLPSARWFGTRIPRLAAFPRPLPAEGAEASSNPLLAPWRAVAARPDGARAMVERLFIAMAAAHARHGIDFLRQPPETLMANGLTSGDYTKGSSRLNNERHPDEDVSHMNARYGALCLRSILDWARQDAPIAA